MIGTMLLSIIAGYTFYNALGINCPETYFDNLLQIYCILWFCIAFSFIFFMMQY